MTDNGKYMNSMQDVMSAREEARLQRSRRRSSSSLSEVDKLQGLLSPKNADILENLSIDDNAKSHLKYKRRTRSLYGVNPDSHFGPKACLMMNFEEILTEPGNYRLAWQHPPKAVLVIKKAFDCSVIPPFVDLITWLIEKKMVVYVEENVLQECHLANSELKNKLTTFRDDTCKDSLYDKIDFIVCLGGDGTLLYASSMFQKSVPPVMAFHLGSLGFLSPFTFDGYKEKVSKILEGNIPLVLRTRLKCTLHQDVMTEYASQRDLITFNRPKYSDVPLEQEETAIPSTLSNGCVPEKKQRYLVLNEVVIDRGQSPFLSNIDLFIEHKHVTTVQGDGLIISTPTGSTAYAAAAGASMIHPNVPAIVIAPICPHSLSFRPIVVPAGVEIKIKISQDTRGNAWLSFDGRNRQEMKRGDILRVQTSTFPVPCVCGEDEIADWFQSLAGCLHWNVRERQHSLNFSQHSSTESGLSNGTDHSAHKVP